MANPKGPPSVRTTGGGSDSDVSSQRRPRASDTIAETKEAKPTPKEGADPFVGTTLLGQYEVKAKIGGGAFGAIYLAEQLGVGRRAVIKLVRPELRDEAVFAKRFQREAAVLAALDHHHLVRLYNFGQLETGELFLAMEYGGDTTLLQVLKAGPLPLARAVAITEQICGALSEAHRHGVVHRDLKPANILVAKKDDADWVKVVDVGIAKMLDSSDIEGSGKTGLTAPDTVVGTPSYISPEQAMGMPIDGRSDLYALGILLYEMLTRQKPLLGKGMVAMMRAHCQDKPRTLREGGYEASPQLEKFIAKALEKKPEDRWQTAAEFAEKLKAATAHELKNEATGAESGQERGPAPSGSQRSPSAEPAPGWQPPKAALIAASVVAVLLVAAAIWAVVGSSRRQQLGAQARAAASRHDFVAARALLSQLPAPDARRQRTDQEAEAQERYQALEAALAAEDFDKARASLNLCSDETLFYCAKAREKADQIREGFVRKHLARAQGLRGSACADEVALVLASEPENEKAKAAAKECAQRP
jgi:serine/threonine protein kinase